MRFLQNYSYKFMAGFHQEVRDFFNRDIFYNPIKVTYHEMRMQKWANKVRD